MVEKENKKTLLYIIAGIILLLLLMKGCETNIKADSEIHIEFRTRDRDSLAIVGGQKISNAEGQFGVSIGNDKGIPIQNIRFSSVSDSTGVGSSFSLVSFPWIIVPELLNGQSTGMTDTTWFDLEHYAVNYPGTTTFYFNFLYDYIGGDGVVVSNIPINGFADIAMFKDYCSDTTPVDTCNSNGEICTWPGNADPVLSYNAGCCAAAGGAWVVGTCVFNCGSLALGECDQTPTPGSVNSNTFCDPATATMIESCQNCVCYDYYGNPSTSCDVNSCVYDDYAGGVIVDVGGAGTQPAPSPT